MTAPLAGDGVPRPSVAGHVPGWTAPPILRGMRAAFALLSRIPVGGHPYSRSADLAWAAGHAPLVGLVLGSALGGLTHLLQPLGSVPAAFLVIGASMLLTGALHEDGLADTADALGGASHRSQIFAILKDSRVGSFGAAALAISIAGRAALLGQVGESAVWALPVAWCAARTGPIWLVATLPYVSPQPQAKSDLVAKAGVFQAVVATAWLLVTVAIAIAAGWMSPARAVALGLTLALVTGVTGWRYWRRAGGTTGDFWGATEQLGELGALAVIAWAG